MRFICQETEPPYLVQIHAPDEEALDLARDLNDRAIRLYADHARDGSWPGYPHLVAEPTGLPTFYYFDRADVLPERWRALEEELVI